MRDSSMKQLNTTPTAMGEITRLAYAHAGEKGVEVDLLLRKAGLTVPQINDPDARLEVRRQIKFLNLVAEVLNDDLLGFHLSQKCELRRAGLLHYVMASSETLNEALQRIARYSSIVNEGIRLTHRAGRMGLTFNYIGVSRHSDSHQIEFWMAAIMRECRQLTQRRLAAEKVSFVHYRSAAPEVRSFYNCKVRFGADADEAKFLHSVRNLPIVSADPYLNNLLNKYCEEAVLHRRTNKNSFATKVENTIAILLPHGQAQVSEVARKLGVSRRTLVRRLASEGLTFTRVVQALRFDLAKRHLADNDLTISKIAWLLGYNDAGAFTRAHKRWTGTSPSTVRRQDLADANQDS